jgi:hypothetical protein
VRQTKPLFLIAGFFASVIVLSIANRQAGTITSAEARADVGQSETVCGRVVSTHHSDEGRRPTFLNLDKPYPDYDFTILIWGADRRKFGEPEEKYRDRTVCVTGKVQSYRGRPEIIARSPSQIRVREPTRNPSISEAEDAST